MEPNAVVETDLVAGGASAADAPADATPPIFVETPDETPAAPTPAPAPDVKAERLAHVRELAQQAKALKAEREALAWQRAQERQEREQMRAELQALQQDPIAYMTKLGVTPQQYAERALFDQSDESAAMRAERLAMETKARLDELATQAMRQQEAAQKIQVWEQAKANALKVFSDGAKDKYADLDAFATKQAARTGESKDEIIVSEIVAFVNKVKTDPRYAAQAAHLDSYTDADWLEAVSQKYEGLASVGKPPAKEKVSHRTISDDNSTMTKITNAAPLGSVRHRKLEAQEIVDAWRAARGDKPEAAPRLYSQEELTELEAKAYTPHGVNRAAEKAYDRALIEHEKAKIAARSKGR